MIRPLTSRAIAADQRGATLVEFAFVVPVMMLMLMGFFDLAHQAYAKSILQGAVQKAGRDATLEFGATNDAALRAKIERQVKRVTGRRAVFTSERLSYTNFRGIGTPENFTDKTPFNNQYDVGECYEDVNANGSWDRDIGRVGQGGAEDAVIYRMTVAYPRLFPMARMLGWSPNQQIVAETVLRNQPYAAQTTTTPLVKCT